MPKRNWSFMDKVIITKRLWFGGHGGAHTSCGICGSAEISIDAKGTEMVGTAVGDLHTAWAVERCRKCGAYGALRDVWDIDRQRLETSVKELNKTERGGLLHETN